MKRWGEKEDIFLQENYHSLPIEDIMKELIGRSETAIRWRAKFLGLTNSRGRDWTDEEIKMIIDRVPVSEIVRKTRRTYTAVMKKKRILEKQQIIKKDLTPISDFFDDGVIDKNIPLLDVYSKSSQYLYLLKKMKVGDSFEYPEDEKTLLRNQIVLFVDRKYKTKKWNDKTRRVWRVK
ncbi:hypothetical protein PG593_04965 [Riemerella anatipestifer]|uniref:Uncharacterized protein n=1 Tax=Riemerella anatipestifer TaxID=34085 RepID=A0AAP6HHF1_RIEAN|nr:hypothetical protein [Riemerella anatipestifer]MDY3529122.1 hypothetical protein [Riemerella anatipestifer]